MKEKVLQAMREAGKPVSAGDVTKALGADRKEVDKAFAELKKEGAIVSPVRCKWELAKKFTIHEGVTDDMCFVVTPVLFIMMKRIIIIDGGPRKAMNTAAMLNSIAQGVKSVSDRIEVKTVRLYELNYKGCMSCLLCKLKGRVSNVCKFKDALTPVLQEIAEADGLVMGSPIYFSEVTAQLRALLERLIFPWLSYNDYSLTVPKRMPVLLTYTMNATAELAKTGAYQYMGIIENSLMRAMGDVEHVDAYYTYQVKNYDLFEMASFPEQAKRQYRDEHWDDDLQRAREAGRRMAQKILSSEK